jgi:glycosyltransferase involved in cell wall biosynthesis
MAVYNGDRHVGRAIESVLSQTHQNFQFVIVDDGSTDRTREVVLSYRDPRVRLVVMNRNVGLSAALNEGLRQANASLVASQDAEDVSEPSRLERQFAVMTAQPRLALLGSQAVAIAEDGTPIGIVRRCVEPATIRWFSVFDNPFIHTSVIFRSGVARALGGFNAAYDPFSQDYDLWCRIMDTHDVANMPDTLVRYRVSETSIIGALDAENGDDQYKGRFERIVRELVATQARRVFGAAAISDADASLMAGLVLGIDVVRLENFLSLFERLLGRYQELCPDWSSTDFRRTLSRQFEALAFRARPATRQSTLSIYMHVLRHHPTVAASVSWPRTIAMLLLGKAGRDRLARWKRRRPVLARS